MTCAVCRQLISAYLDGVAGGRTHMEVAAHLSICAACRAENEEHARLKELLRAMPEVSSRRDFLDRAMNRVRTSPWTSRIRGINARQAYICALIVMVFATLVQMALSPVLLNRLPWIFLLAGVVWASWYYGLGPGLLCVGLATLAADYFFTYPLLSFAINTRQTAIQVTACLCLGLLFGLTVTLVSPHTRMQRSYGRGMRP
jgi:K+-sensing histidine kinase KdpD